MPPFYSTASSSERVLNVHPERVRTVSAGGAATRPAHSPPSSAGTRSYHSGSVGSDGWTDVAGEEDDLEPRFRRPSLRRGASEARPEPKRRHSSRRSVLHTEPEIDLEPRRRHSSRHHHSNHSSHSGRHRTADSRRLPSDESSSTVASHDDYPPYSHHGRYPPPSGYRNMPPAPAPPQSHGGYAASAAATPSYAEAYAAQQALIHLPPQDAYAYPPQASPFGPVGQQSNPFSPMGQQSNLFSPLSSTASSSYFATEPPAPPLPHHRPAGMPRPQSYMGPSSQYGSEVMGPYAGLPPYGPYGAMLSGYHPAMGWYPGLQTQPSAAPAAAKEEKKEEKNEQFEALKLLIQQQEKEKKDEKNEQLEALKLLIEKQEKEKKDEKNEQIEALKLLIQKQDEAQKAREQAMIKKAEEEAAALAAAKAKDEEEKKKKEEIAAASKKAKEDAEKTAEDKAKKAKDEHEKQLKEAEAAKEVAEKKQKEFEAEVAKLKPASDAGKYIRFKDAVGRKFSFPFHICKTWKGMEPLIRQAFAHVDVIGEHVRQGHYDLTGPDGEIILPQVWDVCIQPEWEVSMHMWPMEEKKEEPILVDPFPNLGLADILGDVHKKPSTKKKGGSGSKKEKKHDIGHMPMEMPMGMPMPPPPPPVNYPPGMGGMLPDPIHGLDLFGPPPPPKAKKTGSSKSKHKEPSGFAAWFGGGSSAPKKKR